MLHKDIIFSQTSSSGIALQNTDNLVSCLCKLILISAATSTTTFDLKLIDSGNRVIFLREGITGTYRSTEDEKFKDFSMRDINTIRVENVSTDEALTGKLSVMEVA